MFLRQRGSHYVALFNSILFFISRYKKAFPKYLSIAFNTFPWLKLNIGTSQSITSAFINLYDLLQGVTILLYIKVFTKYEKIIQFS